MTNEPKRLTRASKSSIMHIQEDMPHMSDVSQSATRKDTLAHYMRTACNGSPNIRLDCGTAWQQHSVPETYHFDYVLSALGVSVGFSLCPYLSSSFLLSTAYLLPFSSQQTVATCYLIDDMPGKDSGRNLDGVK